MFFMYFLQSEQTMTECIKSKRWADKPGVPLSSDIIATRKA